VNGPDKSSSSGATGSTIVVGTVVGLYMQPLVATVRGALSVVAAGLVVVVNGHVPHIAGQVTRRLSPITELKQLRYENLPHASALSATP
jgi:uncharacterized protein YjeT (DUF2065 family)